MEAIDPVAEPGAEPVTIPVNPVSAERHFGGATTRFVIGSLREHMSDDAIGTLLDDIGDPRTVDELTDDSTWSSYEQVRLLLEGAAVALGSSARLRDPGTTLLASTPEFATMLQAMGSPAALYEHLGDLSARVSPIVRMTTREIDTNEWLCDYSFTEPFEAFRAYCDFTAGMLGKIPRVFSFPNAEVVEEACQLDGAPQCRMRVRWDACDNDQRRAEYVQLQLNVANARLDAIYATVGKLVSDDGLDRVLQRILASAAKAVNGPTYVLALDDLPIAPQHVYAEGVSLRDAHELARQVLEGDAASDAGRFVVDIASHRRHYGRLVAFLREGGRFFPHEQSSLEAYARLAAAALDSAAALEDARRQAATARTLLELSSALAEATSLEEVTTRLVRSVPAIIDCDRAAAVLIDPETAAARVASTFGYATDAENELLAAFASGDAASSLPIDIESVAHLGGAAAAATCPITGNGELLGWLIASVTDGANRLERDPEVESRLRGLAAQAVVAIRNARLVEALRHQALHDGLTGLPNRSLILDRAEQLLQRGRRNHTTPCVLFIDLDDFKEVNDTLGHAVGDQLLRAVARRLEATLRRSDTVGRFGGDEFILLAESDAAHGAVLAADRLIAALHEPFQLGEHTVHVTASIGIAAGERESADDLLRDADLALYRAKADGKGKYCVYWPAELSTAQVD
jgi:diguanylate cyclase (GGDEF)-like protein